MKRLVHKLKTLLSGTSKTRSALEQDLDSAGLRFSAWQGGARSGPRLYSTLDHESALELGQRFPALRQGTIAAADAFTAHRFRLLGSETFVPKDPDRPERESYSPIDWNLDPVRGLRFPADVPHKGYDPATMRPGNADIKYPWELARCQHLPTLGQAWLLTGDGRYAREILLQIEDFTETGSPGQGVNWVCTMDVAIRAANWAMALDLIKDCPDLDQVGLSRAYVALFDHGAFIAANFEDHYEVTSNHYLSNVVGLYFVATLFRDLPTATDWDAYCRDRFEREINIQILPDGADFESSTAYHRLVLELFLAAGRLASFLGTPLSEQYTGRVRDMAAYHLGVLRPDGTLPASGDSDDGRLHILTQAPNWNPRDGLHILGPAHLHLDRPMALGLRDQDIWECAWWGFETKDLTSASPVMPPSSGLYPDAGHAVFRDGQGTYLLVNNARVGTEGFGNHKHNDQLSFEAHLGGTPLVVDPGSYVYTSDPDSRNLFRSTAYHNTVCMDALEQNDFNPDWLFRMFEKAEAEHLHFGDENGMVAYCGQHRGFERLEKPVVHARAIGFLKDPGAVLILDELAGLAGHAATWHFHLAPGVTARLEPRAAHLEANGKHFVLQLPPGISGSIDEAWYSPSYGVRQRCQALNFELSDATSGTEAFAFVLCPEKLADRDWDSSFNELGTLLQSSKAGKESQCSP